MLKNIFVNQTVILCLLLSSYAFSQQQQTGTLTDQDGNVYKTVTIGNQVWMAENLKVMHYRNGDAIPNINVNFEWCNLSTGAYCNHENNADNATTFGSIYNWFAVNDNRNIAPAGWHVPTDEEWKELEMFLGMSPSEANEKRSRGADEGSKLAGNAASWNDDESLENNAAFGESGFSALPGGSRENSFGNYTYKGINAFFWISTESDSNDAWCRRLYFKRSDVFCKDIDKRYGFSIRCVKDNSTDTADASGKQQNKECE